MRYYLYLDKPNEIDSLIMLYVSVNGFYVRFSTGFKINPKFCNLEGRTKISNIKKSYSNVYEYNKELNRIIDYLKNYLFENNSRGTITKEELKFEYKRMMKPYTLSSNKNLFATLDEYLSEFKSPKNIVSGKSKVMSANTVYIVEGKIRNIKKFCNEKYSPSVSLDTANTSSFVNEYRLYFLNANKKPLTINNNISFLFQFLKWCKNKKYVPEIKVSNKQIRGIEVLTYTLTEAELKALFEVELTDKKINTIRWMFLFQCYSGIRHTDLISLKENFIDNKDGVIILNTRKTDKIIIIPITDKLKIIIDNIDFKNYYTKRPGQYNHYVKLICKLAGINKEVNKIIYTKGQKQLVKVPKYELIGSHTGRRTFITRAIKQGIPERSIMKVTGHTSTESFERYVRLVKSDIKDAFKDFE